MEKTSRTSIFRKKLLTYVAFAALVGGGSFLPMQSLHAQQTPQAVTVVGGSGDIPEYLSLAWEKIHDLIKEHLQTNGNVTAAVNANLHAQMLPGMQDTAANNNRNNVIYGNTGKIATDHLTPSGFSACNLAMSHTHADLGNINSKNSAAALARGQAGRPNDPVTIAQELKLRCDAGLLNPNDTNDPDNAYYKRLFPNGCTPKGPMTAHPGADKSIATLLYPTGYFVPNNFPGVQKDGSYAPIPLPPTGPQADYAPFIDAYMYCQNTTPSQPPAQQGAAGAKATTSDLVSGARRTAQSKQSVNTSCYQALMDRAQFDSSNPYMGVDPHGNPIREYQNQVNRCKDDHAAHLLSDDALLYCTGNGRSNLQAEHDESNLLGANSSYMTYVLATVPTAEQPGVIALNSILEHMYDQKLLAEYQNVQTSVGISAQTIVPASSPLGAAVTPTDYAPEETQPAPGAKHMVPQQVSLRPGL